MKLEKAIRKSDCGVAQRPSRKGGMIVAMVVKGTVRLVRSLENPRVTGLLGVRDLNSSDWSPVAAKEKTN